MMASAGLSGRLSDALRHVLMRRATVVETLSFGGDFHLLTLEGAALRDVEWVPGQKVQVAMGHAFETRTYTPTTWDAVAGRTRLLGYAHGDGPGSRWLRTAAAGDPCDLFGPRGSIDARKLSGPLALFGDETSIALACALTAQDRTRSCTYHFEVGDTLATAKVIDHLGLDPATLHRRSAGDGHIAGMKVTLPALVAARAGFVLAGRAGMVQDVRQAVKAADVPASRVLTKAYWTPGKRGQD